MSNFFKRMASGVGQGLIENSMYAMRKDKDLEYERARGEIAMSQERDMAKFRNDLIEEAKQRRAQAISSGVNADMAALGDKAAPEMRDRAMARHAAIYDGKEGDLYNMQKNDRDFDLREREHQENVANRKDASARGWATINQGKELKDIQVQEARTIAGYTQKYRAALESGDGEAAAKYGQLSGITRGDKEKLTTAAATFKDMARVAMDDGDRDAAQQYLKKAENILSAIGDRAAPRSSESHSNDRAGQASGKKTVDLSSFDTMPQAQRNSAQSSASSSSPGGVYGVLRSSGDPVVIDPRFGNRPMPAEEWERRTGGSWSDIGDYRMK